MDKELGANITSPNTEYPVVSHEELWWTKGTVGNLRDHWLIRMERWHEVFVPSYMIFGVF